MCDGHSRFTAIPSPNNASQFIRRLSASPYRAREEPNESNSRGEYVRGNVHTVTIEELCPKVGDGADDRTRIDTALIGVSGKRLKYETSCEAQNRC